MNEVQNTRGKGLSDEMIARLLLAGDISELSEYEKEKINEPESIDDTDDLPF